VVLSGPSGVGKDTIFEAARAKIGEAVGPIIRSVSHTTRRPRPGEANGEHYHFCSRSEFERRIEAGEFLEWATYIDNYYGTPARWVEEKLASGHHVLLEIEVKGALQVRSRRPEAILIYVLPGSWAELDSRLLRRRTEDPRLRRRRVEVAHEERECLPKYDYVIFNREGEVAQAAEQLCAILVAESCRTSRAVLPPSLGLRPAEEQENA
jgi:guanylate kinase